MTDTTGNLDTLVQEKIDADADFQNSLADLSEEEQATAISEKKTELRNEEFFTLGEKAKKSEDNYESQKIRAEKAEKSTPKNDVEKSEAPKKEETSDEPDLKDKFNKLTLKTEGITHPDDQKAVLDEAKRLDLDVEEVMTMEHIQAKLKANKNQRDAGDAMPDSKGKAGGDFKSEVEYWIDKKNDDGSYQTPDDDELAGKVIAARVNKQKNQAQFEPIRL